MNVFFYSLTALCFAMAFAMSWRTFRLTVLLRKTIGNLDHGSIRNEQRIAVLEDLFRGVNARSGSLSTLTGAQSREQERLRDDLVKLAITVAGILSREEKRHHRADATPEAPLENGN